MLLQVPTPPPPPVPPLPPGIPDVGTVVVGAPPGKEVVMIVVAVMLAAVIILWPLMRALARRLEGKGATDPSVLQELDELRARVQELELHQGHVAELEERLDFAERLLAQRSEPARVEAPRIEGAR